MSRLNACSLGVFIIFGMGLTVSAAAQSQAPPRPNADWPDTVLGAEALRELPSSRDAWSIIETADPLVVVDGIGNGGLFTGRARRMSARGASWTETSYRLDGLDVTNPSEVGTTLWYPDLDLLQAVTIAPGAPSIDMSASGTVVTLVPRAPADAWRGQLQAAVTPGGLQASSIGVVPPIARFDSWTLANGLASGPLLANRVKLLAAATVIRSRAFSRDEAVPLDGNVTSLFADAQMASSPRDRLRGLAMWQAVAHPYAGRARYSGRDVPEDDRFLHLQSTWEHAGGRDRGDADGGGGVSWSIAGGYQRGRFTPAPASASASAAGAAFQAATIERLVDGPVEALVDAPGGVRQQWQASGQATFHLRGTLRVGASVARASAATSPVPGGDIAELVDGIPARVWSYTFAASATAAPAPSDWRTLELAAYASDSLTLADRLTLEPGLRVERASGDARGGGAITWRSLLPRLAMRAALDRDSRGRDRLALVAHYIRSQARLPLDDFAFGDPASPTGSVYRWQDANGDRQFQPDERGQFIAVVGHGHGLGTIDPALAPPRAREVLVGVEAQVLKRLTVRFAGVERSVRDLVAAVNVGVPLASANYDTMLIPDRGLDFINPADDRPLSAYNRLAASFGQDRYLLTNPAGDTLQSRGVELTLSTTLLPRCTMQFGATASRDEGDAANRGFRAIENDPGVIGERFDTPNAATYARGRLFFDRAYVVKTSGTYAAPYDTHVGVIARYQDGQPFSRLVIVPDLNQGAEAIRAYPAGETRFAYTLTLDLRVDKGFTLPKTPHRLAAVLDVFNLLNTAKEVEEDVVTEPTFRRPVARQPPRAVRLGLRVDF